MSLQARIKHIEREFRRLDRQAQAEAASQIEYIFSESFLPNIDGKAPAGPGKSKRNVVFIMPRPGGKQAAKARGNE